MRKNATFKPTGTRCLLHMDFSLLGAFAKLLKATISFVASVRPSARPHRTIRLQLEGFS
jgi:hypothetical protein